MPKSFVKIFIHMNTKFTPAIMIIFLLAILGSCANAPNETKEKSSADNKPVTAPSTSPQASESEPKSEEKSANAVEPSDKKDTANQNHAACYSLKRDDMALDKKQTFGIDFPPFGKSCFVVFHDPEFDNPPLNSQYFIYKDGKEAFEFPGQFNGSNIGCWIEAVSFEDMNGDGLNDIAIAAKCSAKSKPYPENMVYINTGKDFMTSVTANEEMMDFTKMSQIIQYVKEHQSLFAK